MAENAARIECPYPDCDKDYSDQGYLDNHIESKHADEVDPEEEAEPSTEEVPVEETPDEFCDNHPDREAIWASDGVTASVVRYCEHCKERYT